jgi:Xaa-Pro aminopeptidase
VRSFEIQNSTKPFAGLFIPKKEIKPILITDNKSLKKIDKLNKNFDLMSQKKFISYILKSKINSIETNFRYSNYDIYLSLIENISIKETKIDIDKKISQKTKVEFNNIILCHIQDGISLTKFILQSKNNNKSFKDEYSIAHNLYQLRKQGVNFFRNSFDYISAFDENAAIVHYKPSQVSSQKLSNQSLLLLDSGAHYLEGTTDVTRVIKFNKLKFKNIKTFYTYLLKSLILVENTIFHKGITGFDLDLFIRSYLSKYNIFYGHGTGHGVGYFNDVHEKYPVLSTNSKQIILNNNLFSIEPGFYMNNKFGLRLENLYFSKILNKKVKLINVTLVPYDLSLIDWKLVTKKERNFIKNYHIKIFENIEMHLSVIDRRKYTKSLINKI